MSFIEAYKHLEKLCGEVLNDERCISAYIDEMTNTTHGSYFVKDWNKDLKQLKHYRWIRNKIVHEPNCTEQNMCEPKDEAWLEDFYSRIMRQDDPLALYFKAVKNHQAAKSKQIHKRHHPSKAKKTIKIFAVLLPILVFIVILIKLILDNKINT